MNIEICNNPGGCRTLVENPNKLQDFDRDSADQLFQDYCGDVGSVVLLSCTQMCNYINGLTEAAKQLIEEGNIPVASVRVNSVRKPQVAYVDSEGNFDTKEI